MSPSAFLRGIFDSEGGVRLRKKIKQSSIGMNNTDREIIRLVSDGLKILGIDFRVYEGEQKGRGTKRVYWVSIKKREHIHKFMELVGFSIARKNEKYQLYKNALIQSSDFNKAVV
jgi:intein-encoded DNA endonuclease-like protein